MNLIGCRRHQSVIGRLAVSRGPQNKVGEVGFDFNRRMIGRDSRHDIFEGASHDLDKLGIKLRHVESPIASGRIFHRIWKSGVPLPNRVTLIT